MRRSLYMSAGASILLIQTIGVAYFHSHAMKYLNAFLILILCAEYTAIISWAVNLFLQPQSDHTDFDGIFLLIYIVLFALFVFFNVALGITTFIIINSITILKKASISSVVMLAAMVSPVAVFCSTPLGLVGVVFGAVVPYLAAIFFSYCFFQKT